ncbi:MAG: Ni/Fe hydrogenase subunit alpha [Candidatus Hadarchaeota archaeon]
MSEVKLVERVEGHVGLDIDLESKEEGGVKFGIAEGPRLFEKMMEGRKYDEVPFFVSRICGFCPIVHNLGAIKALEGAMGIEANEVVSRFRRALNLMEFVQSHSAHLYVLTLPDLAGDKADLFSLKSEFPEEVKKAVRMRMDINSMIETLGGRIVHPLSTRVGGFSKLPNEGELEEGIEKLDGMMPVAEETVDLIAGLDYPDLDMGTNCLSLGRDDDRYPTYEGYVITSNGKKFEVDDYSEVINEETRIYSTAKYSSIDGEPYLTGAISRMNLNKDSLCGRARSKLKDMDIEFPSTNPYHNNVAQAIEIVNSLEEIKEIYSWALSEDLGSGELKGREMKGESDIKVEAGSSADAVEAPRGTLFHYYEVDDDGYISDADIITPTAQSANNIERDINILFSKLGDLSRAEIRKRIKALIRAYDPCISCSVH